MGSGRAGKQSPKWAVHGKDPCPKSLIDEGQKKGEEVGRPALGAGGGHRKVQGRKNCGHFCHFENGWAGLPHPLATAKLEALIMVLQGICPHSHSPSYSPPPKPHPDSLCTFYCMTWGSGCASNPNASVPGGPVGRAPSRPRPFLLKASMHATHLPSIFMLGNSHTSPHLIFSCSLSGTGTV